MTDTSTQAVGAMAERILRAAGSSLGNYTLYRQRILDEVRYAMSYGETMAKASARRSALEEAAQVAEFYPVAGKITDEGFVPGPNYKSAIAFAIRALAEKEG